MFYTLTNVQREGSVSLWRPLDNRDGRACVALRSLTYNVGWYNIHEDETISWQNSSTGESGVVGVPAGLYSFEALARLLQAGNGLVLKVNQENGVARLEVPLSISVKLGSNIQHALGLDVPMQSWLGPGTYAGVRPINLAPTTALFIHLDQLSTTFNMVDGTPSSLLGIVSLGCEAFGENATIYLPSPEYKHLRQDYITELSVSVRDAKGSKIDNHNLPISLSLEVVTVPLVHQHRL